MEAVLLLGAWRSQVAHQLWELGVPGSNPGAPTVSADVGASPLTASLLLLLREAGSAAGTLLRAMVGLGASARFHTGKAPRLSSDSPVVAEVVEREENIQEVLPRLHFACPPDARSAGPPLL